MLCVTDESVQSSLVGFWIDLLRQKKIESITATFLESNPMIRLFKRFGFRIRPDNSSVFAYAREGSGVDEVWTNGENWYMTVGDRDV